MDLKTFKPQGFISIQQVLMRVKYNPIGETFSIGFCRATPEGKACPKGQIVWYDKALYGAPAQIVQRNGSKGYADRQNDDAVSARDYRKDGLLPIHNYETKEYKTPLIGSIMFFESKVVKHPDDGSEE